MSILAAALIVLAQGDPRDRLLEAIRETHVENTQKALADLVQGDGARAARAVMAALPKARERLNVLIDVTQRARMLYSLLSIRSLRPVPPELYIASELLVWNAYSARTHPPILMQVSVPGM